MKLFVIYQARDAWKRLLRARMSPVLAYRVLKYAKGIEAEDVLLETRRAEIIKRVGTEEEGQWRVVQGTPAHAAFVEEFSALLDADVELAQAPFSLESVLDDLAKFEENAIAATDIAALEPFFAAAKE